MDSPLNNLVWLQTDKRLTTKSDLAAPRLDQS